MAKHSQTTQSNKFGMFSQYLITEIRDGVQFLHANKHQGWCKLRLSFYEGSGQTRPMYQR